VDRLRHLATLHPLSAASSPVPQYRLFADEGGLCVEGEIDSFAIGQLRLALQVLPPKTQVLIDLAVATLRSRKTLASLGSLCDDGVVVTIRGVPAAIGRLRASGLPGSEGLTLHELQPS